MTRPFTKPPTTHHEQVELLIQRGMSIDDTKVAGFYLSHLSHLSYYRLAAYWLPFEFSHSDHRFKPGTSFPKVLNFYLFDRELRLLVLDAIERIEVSVRARWAYELSHRHGAHAHLDVSLARKRWHWESNLEKLKGEVRRSDEPFIRHLQETYSEELPPVWAVCEVMSLGSLSRWFANLKPGSTRSAIAKSYKVDERSLQSWLHHLSIIRNHCAHHSRLWNREFTVTPNIPTPAPKLLRDQFFGPSRKIYNSLVLILYLMDSIAPAHHWRKRMKALIKEHAIPTAMMGFPEDWFARPIWQER